MGSAIDERTERARFPEAPEVEVGGSARFLEEGRGGCPVASASWNSEGTVLCARTGLPMVGDTS